MPEYLSVPLSELIDTNRNISYGIVQPGSPVDDGVPIIRVSDVRNGRISTVNPLRVHRDIEAQYLRTRLRGGELLLTIVGTIGETAIVPKELADWNVARAIAVLPIRDDVGAYWVQLALKSPFVRSRIDSRLNTTVQATLNLGDVAQLPILLPPKPERGRIESLLNALDEKIDVNRCMNETLEATARAIFKDWFVDFGPTRAKAEGLAPYLAPEICSRFPDRLDQEEKPEGWEKRPLTAFFSIIGGGTPKTSIEDYWGGTIPWFSVVDTPSTGVFVVATDKTITQKGLEESSARLVPEGTTIVSARGTVGNLAIAGQDMAFNQSCYGLRGKGDAGRCFVFLAAQHVVGRLQSMAHGSVFSTITTQTFEAVTLAMSQGGVLVAFEEIVQPLFSRMKANVVESRTLTATRDLLLPKLMSGEIRVSDPARLVGHAACS